MKLGDWIDERTGYRSLVKSFVDLTVPGGARFAYAWAGAMGLMLLVVIVTGVLMSTVYAPSTTTAWASVMYLQQKVPLGWLVRGLHQFGAQSLIILGAIHIGHAIIHGAYRKPREFTYWLSLLLLGLVVASALTGNPLRWDQRGFWALRVETSIMGTMPIVGTMMQEMLLGGSLPGNMTLTRLYTLHTIIFPLVLIGLFVKYVWLAKKHGPALEAPADATHADPYFPSQFVRDLLVALVVLGAVFALTLQHHGAPFDAPADPTSDYPARPEWYFLALYEMRKPFPGRLELIATVLLPGLVVGYLVLLPLLDKKADRGVMKRLPLLVPVALFGVGAGVLTFASMKHDAGDADFLKAVAKAAAQGKKALAISTDGVPPDGALAMMRNHPETRRVWLFEQHCASCHRMRDLGPAVGKDTAPDLTGFGSRPWIKRVLEEPDHDSLFGKTAFKGMMPSMTKPPADPELAKEFSPMKEEDLNAIADFLETQATGKMGEGLPGEKLVRQRCTSCHRLDGKTDDEESLAPELRGWASISWILSQIDEPGGGATYPKGVLSDKLEGHMPGFADKLNESDRKLLASFVHGESGAVVANVEPPPVRNTTASATERSPVVPADSNSVAPAASASTMPTASASASAPVPTAGASAPAITSSSATQPPPKATAAVPKTYECGGKGQKNCPMQGWMRGVMGPATSSGDPERIAKALSYIAAKPPPGMGSWAAIAADGAAKAKAGDIDGAKGSCTKCHALYKDRYKNFMRDMPW